MDGRTSSCLCSLGSGDSRDTAPPGTLEGGMAGEGWLVHTNLLLGELPGPPSLVLEQEQLWGPTVTKTLFGQPAVFGSPAFNTRAHWSRLVEQDAAPLAVTEHLSKMSTKDKNL